MSCDDSRYRLVRARLHQLLSATGQRHPMLMLLTTYLSQVSDERLYRAVVDLHAALTAVLDDAEAERASDAICPHP